MRQEREKGSEGVSVTRLALWAIGPLERLCRTHLRIAQGTRKLGNSSTSSHPSWLWVAPMGLQLLKHTAGESSQTGTRRCLRVKAATVRGKSPEAVD